ncbi:MAG: hypothetical protein WCC11_01265, partial [Gammaproteobacteria bacterium]
VHDFLAAADQFMGERKRIVGATTPQAWREGRIIGDNERILKLPIEVGGEQHPEQTLVIAACPDADNLKFLISLVFRWSIFRLDYEIGRRHVNVNRPQYSNIPYTVIGPHYHPWAENKPSITSISEPFKLPWALPLDVHIRQFDGALRWFCQQTNIEIGNHQIMLPPKERLL